MHDEGSVKFRACRRAQPIAWSADLEALNRVRDELAGLRLIGVYPDGVGYGNVSLRTAGQAFTITGTATGGLAHLEPRHWCQVERCFPAENRVETSGEIDASAESMTHDAIYRADARVRCVLHIHSRRVFDHLLAVGAPRTAADIPYGTPAMAAAVSDLVERMAAPHGVFVMAGHDEGVMAYGPDLASSRSALLAVVAAAGR